MTVRTATVITHRSHDLTTDALNELIVAARRAGVTLRLDPDETARHGLERAEGIEVDVPLALDSDICVVLGGDGTILSALRTFAGTGVPVFAVNFGEVGFLATIDPDGLPEDFARAFNGEFDRMEMPAMALPRLTDAASGGYAINDVSVHRKTGLRVADLAYALGADEIGRVRCDGLVVSTPAGSTGYNLANGGPVLAWGVEGFVVSFVAPHSLTARALVVAPDDRLRILNASRSEPVDVFVDGRPACELAAGDSIEVMFVRAVSVLAQQPGATFYHRLRERFGRLAQ